MRRTPEQKVLARAAEEYIHFWIENGKYEMNVKKITDKNAAEVAVYTQLNEKQLKRFYEPQEGIFICESIRVIKRAIEAGFQPRSFFVEDSMLEEVRQAWGDYPVPAYTMPYEFMKSITGYSLTGGVLSAMQRKPMPSVEECILNASKIVVLDDIENPTNVGAIFRCAVALGADAIVLTEGCADPLYRRAARVSMGSVFKTKWTFVKSDIAGILRESGFESFALALSEEAEELGSLNYGQSKRKAVILGNEDHGISKEIISECDHVVMIPMQHEVDSINVAAASAVAFWEIFKG